LSWIVVQGISTVLIEPGKPWQNGVTESFNGKFRDECLSLEWFRSRAQAKVIIETPSRHIAFGHYGEADARRPDDRCSDRQRWRYPQGSCRSRPCGTGHLSLSLPGACAIRSQLRGCRRRS
jgi:hypothetical protein